MSTPNDNILPDLSDLSVKKPTRAKDWRGLADFAKGEGFAVTSTTGGGHNRGSAHYAGRAVDVRVRDKKPDEVDAFIGRAQGQGYGVRDERVRPAGQKVWGGPHVHLQIDSVAQTPAPRLPDLSDLSTQTSRLPDLSDLSTSPPPAPTPPSQGEAVGANPTTPAGPPTPATPARPHQLAPGNIDLTKRPVVKNTDGSISTVRSISVNIDGREVLIPTVSDDGKILTDEQAVDLYKRTGKHLGMFDSPEAATAYAQSLHEQQAEMYGGKAQASAPQLPAAGSSVRVPIAPGDTAEGILLNAFRNVGKSAGLSDELADQYARQIASEGVQQGDEFVRRAQTAGQAAIGVTAQNLELLNRYVAGQQSGRNVETQMSMETGVEQPGAREELDAVRSGYWRSLGFERQPETAAEVNANKTLSRSTKDFLLSSARQDDKGNLRFDTSQLPSFQTHVQKGLDTEAAAAEDTRLRQSLTPEDHAEIERRGKQLSEAYPLSRATTAPFLYTVAAGGSDVIAGVLKAAEDLTLTPGLAEQYRKSGANPNAASEWVRRQALITRSVVEEAEKQKPLTGTQKVFAYGSDLLANVALMSAEAELGGSRAAFGGGSFFGSLGRGSGYGKAAEEGVKGLALDKVFKVTEHMPAPQRAVVLAGATYGIERAAGADDKQALEAAVTNAGFVGVPAALGKVGGLLSRPEPVTTPEGVRVRKASDLARAETATPEAAPVENLPVAGQQASKAPLPMGGTRNLIRQMGPTFRTENGSLGTEVDEASKRIFIQKVHVDEVARGKGQAQQLYSQMAKWAGDNGYEAFVETRAKPEAIRAREAGARKGLYSLEPTESPAFQRLSAAESPTHHSDVQPRTDSGQFRKVTTKDLREAREAVPEGVNAVRSEQPTDVSGVQPGQLPDAPRGGGIRSANQTVPAAEVGAPQVRQVGESQETGGGSLPDAAAGAPPVQPEVAQPTRARGAGADFGKGLTRSYQAGMNRASLTFDSLEQRDLFDLTARGSDNVSLQEKQRRASRKEQVRDDLARRLGVTPEEVTRHAFAVRDDVRSQMKGVGDGEARKLTDNVLKAAPALSKSASAPDPSALREGFKQSILTKFKLPERQAEAVAIVTDALDEGLTKWGLERGSLLGKVRVETGKGEGAELNQAAENAPLSQADPVRARNVERIADTEGFTNLDEDDGYFYHVTSSDRVDSIMREGIRPGARSIMGGEAYAGHSAGKVFLTERSGVSFWKDRAEEHLFDRYDDPPNVVVLRVPKSIVKAVVPDEVGTRDARRPAYATSETLRQSNRAAISFLKDGRAVIRALDNPNVSSGAHEVHHVFAPKLAEATLKTPDATLRETGEAFFKWMGFKGAEEFGALHQKWVDGTLGRGDKARYVEGQEKGARGFERYLKTGKAPSEKLRQVFEDFKLWLTSIYGAIRGKSHPLNVKLSEEATRAWDSVLGAPKGGHGQLTHQLHKAPSEGTPAFFENAQVKRALGLKPDASTEDVRWALARETGKPRSSHVTPEDLTKWVDSKGLQGAAREALDSAVAKYRESIKAPTAYQQTGIRRRNVNPETQSLAEFVRAMGGIRVDRDLANRGELESLTNKESGSAGLVRRDGMSVHDMALAAAEAGYPVGSEGGYVRNDLLSQNAGAEEASADTLVELLGRDLGGDKVYSHRKEHDYEAEYRRQNPDDSTEALEAFVLTEEGGKLFDKVHDGQASRRDITAFRRAAGEAGIHPEHVAAIIARGQSAKAEDVQGTPRSRPEDDFDFRDDSVDDGGPILFQSSHEPQQPNLPKAEDLRSENHAYLERFRGQVLKSRLLTHETSPANVEGIRREGLNRPFNYLTAGPRDAEGSTLSFDATKLDLSHLFPDPFDNGDAGMFERVFGKPYSSAEMGHIEQALMKELAAHPEKWDEALDAVRENVSDNHKVSAVYVGPVPKEAIVSGRGKAKVAGEQLGFVQEGLMQQDARRPEAKPQFDDAKTDAARRALGPEAYARLSELKSSLVARLAAEIETRVTPQNAQTAPDLLAALSKLSELKRQKQSVTDYLRQDSLFGARDLSRAQERMLARLDANPRKLLDEMLPAEPEPQQDMLFQSSDTSSRRQKAYRALLEAKGQMPLEPGMKAEAKKEPRTLLGTLRDTFNLMRSFEATGEASFLGRQGLWGFLTHPVKSGRAAAESARAFKANPEKAAEIEAAVKKSPHYQTAIRAGLEFTGSHAKAARAHEEDYQSGFASKLPVVRNFEQAATVFANAQRLGIFELYAKHLEKKGVKFGDNPKPYKAAASLINVGSGRGNLGVRGNLYAAELSTAIFSPRYTASRFQLLNRVLNPVSWLRQPKEVRMKMLADHVKYVGLLAVTGALLKQAGADVSLDPEDPDFLKAKWGTWRYDFTAGSASTLRYLMRMSKAAVKGAAGNLKEGEKDAFGISWDYFKLKAAPGPRAVAELVTRKNVVGEDVTPVYNGEDKSTLLRAFVPIFYAELVDAYRKEGMVGVGKVAPSAVGVGVTQYEEKGSRGARTSTREGRQGRGGRGGRGSTSGGTLGEWFKDVVN